MLSGHQSKTFPQQNSSKYENCKINAFLTHFLVKLSFAKVPVKSFFFQVRQRISKFRQVISTFHFISL